VSGGHGFILSKLLNCAAFPLHAGQIMRRLRNGKRGALHGGLANAAWQHDMKLT